MRFSAVIFLALACTIALGQASDTTDSNGSDSIAQLQTELEAQRELAASLQTTLADSQARHAATVAELQNELEARREQVKSLQATVDESRDRYTSTVSELQAAVSKLEAKLTEAEQRTMTGWEVATANLELLFWPIGLAWTTVAELTAEPRSSIVRAWPSVKAAVEPTVESLEALLEPLTEALAPHLEAAAEAKTQLEAKIADHIKADHPQMARFEEQAARTLLVTGMVVAALVLLKILSAVACSLCCGSTRSPEGKRVAQRQKKAKQQRNRRK